MKRLFRRIILKILRKKIVRNFNKYCSKKIGHALLYYKTDPFICPGLAKEYPHTNHWEVLEMVKILNKLGFWVDIIDTNVNLNRLFLEDKYDVFIGLGGGGSGRYYADITRNLKKPIKILYTASQESSIFNKALKKRYQYFFQRHPETKAKFPYRRMRHKIDTAEIIQNTDYMFSKGNENTMNTFKDYAKPIYRIYPSTCPDIEFNLQDFANRNQKKFLYFAGHGNILKGLDLLIETFAELYNLELYICTPTQEKEFNLFYKNILSKAKNIHWIGFVRVAGKTFNELTSQCGYVILPSCTEGSATSVVTCMRKGLIPIVTPETGIDIDDFGYLIENIRIDFLKDQIKAISQESRDVFIKRGIKTYLNSFDYTQAKFSQSFEKALIDVWKTELQ